MNYDLGDIRPSAISSSCQTSIPSWFPISSSLLLFANTHKKEINKNVKKCTTVFMSLCLFVCVSVHACEGYSVVYLASEIDEYVRRCEGGMAVNRSRCGMVCCKDLFVP